MQIGQIDIELNTLSKLLLAFMACLSLIIVCINGIQGNWFVLYFRYNSKN